MKAYETLTAVEMEMDRKMMLLLEAADAACGVGISYVGRTEEE